MTKNLYSIFKSVLFTVVAGTSLGLGTEAKARGLHIVNGRKMWVR